MTTQKITLKPGWYRRGRTRQLLSEGYHEARCETVQFNDSDKLEATFVIIEENEHYGRHIVQRFDCQQDEELLYELISHLGVREDARSVSTKKLTNTPIFVCITHGQRADGTYHETITGYRAVPGTP